MNWLRKSCTFLRGIRSRRKDFFNPHSSLQSAAGYFAKVRDQKSNSPSSLVIWVAMISVYMVWGSTYLAIRFAVQTMPPFLMAGARFLIAGSVLYLIRRARGDTAPSLEHWRSAAIIGILLLVGGNGGVVWAEQWVASGVTALLVGTAPLWMIMIDVLHPARRRPSRWAIGGLVLGFVGIGVLIGPPHIVRNGGNVDLAGAVVLILASLSWAIGSLYNRQAILPSSPLLGYGHGDACRRSRITPFGNPDWGINAVKPHCHIGPIIYGMGVFNCVWLLDWFHCLHLAAPCCTYSIGLNVCLRQSNSSGHTRTSFGIRTTHASNFDRCGDRCGISGPDNINPASITPIKASPFNGGKR